MGTIKALYERVKRLNTDDVSFEAMDATSGDLADTNKKQLFEGQNAEGGPVGQYRNEQYAEMKNRMNPKPGFGFVDLRLTGNFYNRITTTVIGESVITESTDEKAADLAAKYGDRIYGLNATFKPIYIRDSLRPEFNRRITSLTGLKFG